METTTVTPQQARDAARSALALVCTLGARVLAPFAAVLQAAGNVDIAQFLAVSKQIVEATRELNRMDACEQRAAATALRREQFEAKRAQASRAQSLRDLESQAAMADDATGYGPHVGNAPGQGPHPFNPHGHDPRAQVVDEPGDAQGRKVFHAAVQYAPMVLEHVKHDPTGTLPDMPHSLIVALMEGGLDPDNISIKQGLINRMIESQLLPGLDGFKVIA